MAMAMSVNKRKRDSQDMANVRSAPGLGTDGGDFDAQYLHTDEDPLDGHEGNIDLAAVFGQHTGDPSLDQQQDTQTHDQQQQQQQRMHVQGGLASGNNQSASDTATAALAQYHTMTVPQPTEQAFMNQPTEGGDRQTGTELDQMQSGGQHGEVDFSAQQQREDSSSSNPANDRQNGGSGGAKPAVGTDEWHRVRRDNHKEVERRRRETINEGINELAKIVPGCEKNKGQILARAVQFITQLKDNETQNIQKWSLEKLLTEQAIAELSSSCDKLKAECQRAWTESERWKKAASKAGISPDEKPAHSGGVGDDDDDGDA